MEKKTTDCLTQIRTQILEAKEFGFYWDHYQQLISHIHQECDEVSEVIDKDNQEDVKNEVGDLIHITLGLIIFLGYDLEEIMTKSAEKFQSRFNLMRTITQEKGFASMKDLSITDKLALWNEAKKFSSK